MFTGIIRHVGSVLAVRETAGGRRLRIDLGPLVDGLVEGDSVAVDGLCLTATDIAPPAAEFDVIRESLSRSTLGGLRVGGEVNLERALRADGRLDGHIVQGHVDGVATVDRVDRGGEQWVIAFRGERPLVDQMVPKGSIAISGVSLTLVHARDNAFSVAVIPTTLKETTLADLAPGDRVNIEADILGKYVRRYLETLGGGSSGGLTLEKLRDAGFA
jgi:riboflavin synthase